MSRYSGAQHEMREAGKASTRREVKKLKRAEAEARNSRTPIERTKRFRLTGLAK